MTPSLPSRPSTPSHHEVPCEWNDQEHGEQEHEESDQEYWYEPEARGIQDDDEHEICKAETDDFMEVSTDISGSDDAQREALMSFFPVARQRRR